VGAQFQLGDKITLTSPTKLDVIATSVVTSISGQLGVHRCTQVDIGWYGMQLVEIVESFGNIPLFIRPSMIPYDMHIVVGGCL